jgi:hypothetical protein
MPIRFQADADLSQVIVSAVVRRMPAVDFRTAVSAGLAGLKDRDVLAIAARDGRVLVTHDQATMPRHFREFVRSQRSSGVIIVPQHLPVRNAADDLILIWATTEAEEWGRFDSDHQLLRSSRPSTIDSFRRVFGDATHRRGSEVWIGSSSAEKQPAATAAPRHKGASWGM